MHNTTCNYCGQPIEKRVKSCPSCGTLNPGLRTKEALLWTIGMIVVFYVVTRFMS